MNPKNKLFIFEGDGIYLGCTVIARAPNKKQAAEAIKKQLETHHLFIKNSDFEQRTKQIPQNQDIVYFDNGDY